jgi:7-carboxy-7-deazaguanine synthase
MNTQTVTQQLKEDTDFIDIQEIFYSIQGEGINTGRPSLFIRFNYCNLSKVCTFCDTKYSDINRFHYNEIVEQVKSLITPNILVTISGGESFVQPTLSKLVKQLLSENFEVQIETNGTLWNSDITPLVSNEKFSLICSPKTPKIHKNSLLHIKYWKYLINEDTIIDEMSGFPFNYDIPLRSDKIVFLQPMDENNVDRNKKNVKKTIELCKRYNHRLSLQTHKFLDIR